MSGGSLALHEEVFANLARCVQAVVSRPVLAHTQPRIDREEWRRAVTGGPEPAPPAEPTIQPVQMIVIP